VSTFLNIFVDACLDVCTMAEMTSTSQCLKAALPSQAQGAR
jgi:hypothetical protein